MRLGEFHMSKVILKGYILVSDSDLPAVEVELPNHVELTRNETGCLIFEVSQDREKRNRFNVYEEFSNREAFESHQQRTRNSKWGEITANVERHYKIEGVELL